MPEPNVTMVAFHGMNEKPESLRNLIQGVLEKLTSNEASESSFKPYGIRQMHATEIGMEVFKKERQTLSYWFQKNRRKEISVDLKRAAEIIAHHFDRPFSIRFGGFEEGYCTCKDKAQSALGGWPCATGAGSFHSCDRTPFEGSFYCFSPGPAMITGWPVIDEMETNRFPHSLYELRSALEPAGLLDKYHSDTKPHWRDDDFFIRIGTFQGRLENRPKAEKLLRDHLSMLKPIVIPVGVNDISIVLYDDPSLEEAHIKARVPLAEFLDDPNRVQKLYDSIP